MSGKFPIRIHRQPLLVDGGVGLDQDGRIVIYVDSEQSDEELAVTLWHEAVHLLMLAAGVPASNHNEERIERAARKLAEACPEIVKMCGL